MTSAAEEFLEHFEMMKRLLCGGMPIFAAMAASFEDKDWHLVYAATAALAADIVKRDGIREMPR